MRKIEISLGTRSYQILIGGGLLGHPELLNDWLKGQQVLVVSNETVAPLYLQQVLGSIEGRQVETLILPDGEIFKTLESWQQIIDRLVSISASRDSCLIALGGGVIGDLTGFAAASYMRGISFIQIPTTLLSQVDASVGGKTGINHSAGKNLIGAFHQPCGVLIDTDTLASLPAREYRAGLAEVFKYGLIMDARFLEWLEQNLEALLLRDTDCVTEAIERCCQNKASIVAADERELGIRALLNLGHTFAHAIEALTGYQRYLHGEAVAIGCLLAVRLSANIGLLEPGDIDRLSSLLQRSDLPFAVPKELSARQIVEKMRLDKKNRSGTIRLVLLENIGVACVRDDIDEKAILEVIRQSTESTSLE